MGYKCLWVQKRLLQSALVQSILTGTIRNTFTLLQRKIQTRQEKKFMGIKNIDRFKTAKSPSLGVFKHRVDEFLPGKTSIKDPE